MRRWREEKRARSAAMALSDLPGILEMVLWGAPAPAAMTGMMQGALGLGLSRLTIPFMAGAMFSGPRRMVTVFGVALYILGCWAIAVLYFLFHRHTVGAEENV